MKPDRGFRISLLAVTGGVLLNFLSTLFSILKDRPLIQDGSFWVFRILDQQATSYGHNNFRYLSAAFELPALALRRLSGDNDWTTQIVKVWESALALHPYGWLLICFFILKGARKLFLFPIALLSFALSTQIAQVFPSNPTTEVLSIFWVVIALLVCADLKSLRVVLGICFCSILLCLSHEVAILAFGMLFFISAFEAIRRPAQRNVRVFLCSVFALGGVECLARAAYGNYPTAEGLFAQTWVLAGRFKLHLEIPIGIVFIRLLGRWRNRFTRFEHKACWLLAVVCLIDAAIRPIPKPAEFIMARLLCVFVALVCAFYFWMASAKDFPAKLSFRTSLNFLVAAALLFSARADFSVTSQWSRGLDNLGLIERVYGRGCHLIPKGDYVRFLFPYGFTDVDLPPLTVVLQKSRRLDRILFTPHQWTRTSPEEICPRFENQGMMAFFGEYPLFPSRYFSFRTTKQSEARGP